MSSLQELVDALASEFGRPVGVDDRHFRALAYSSHREDVDAVRRDSILRREAPSAVTGWLLSLGIEGTDQYARIPANPGFGMDPRLCLPLRFDGATLGYLWVIDRPPVEDASSLQLLLDYAEQLAVELVRVRHLENAERERQARVLLGLLSDGDRGAAEELSAMGVLTGARNFAVSVAQVWSGVDAGGVGPDIGVHLSLAAEEVRRRIASNLALAVVQSNTVILAFGFEDPAEPPKRGRTLLDACHRHLASAAGEKEGMEVVVGVGAARQELAELPASHREARLAGLVGRQVSAIGNARPVLWNDLGAYRAIAMLVGDRAVDPPLTRSIEKLLLERDGDSLVETAEAYLDRAGDAKGTADALFLHRSSLYKRLHRLERLTGFDLRLGEDRLELHLALRLWRLAGRRSSPPGG